jgi:glycosyltransferase involved in cell wall biosynthesis
VPIYLVSSPSKTVESLAAGRPVVATTIPDQQTVVGESGGGLIAPYRPDAFADAVSALLSDPQRRGAMGAAGRNWVREHRSYEGLATTLELAYVEAIRRRR